MSLLPHTFKDATVVDTKYLMRSNNLDQSNLLSFCILYLISSRYTNHPSRPSVSQTSRGGKLTTVRPARRIVIQTEEDGDRA